VFSDAIVVADMDVARLVCNARHFQDSVPSRAAEAGYDLTFGIAKLTASRFRSTSSLSSTWLAHSIADSRRMPRGAIIVTDEVRSVMPPALQSKFSQVYPWDGVPSQGSVFCWNP
jgi:hypothetical protein